MTHLTHAEEARILAELDKALLQVKNFTMILAQLNINQETLEQKVLDLERRLAQIRTP